MLLNIKDINELGLVSILLCTWGVPIASVRLIWDLNFKQI